MDAEQSADLAWLTSPEAASWIAQAAAELSTMPRALTHLRKSLSPQRAARVLELARLRQRAHRKFGPSADRMFFTEVGLEQATDPRIAANKAEALPSGDILDVGCGIGGDAIAFAARNPLTAVDIDPTSAEFARANLELFARIDFQVRCVDGTRLDPGKFAIWHCDPDRRPQGFRTTDVAWMRPESSELLRMAERNPNFLLKLAPATDATPLLNQACAREWVGYDGECKQQLLRGGCLATVPDVRIATVIPRESDAPVQRLVGAANASFPHPATGWGAFLVEPHAAVLAAGLVASLCAQEGCRPVRPGLAYLTADMPLAAGLTSTYKLLARMPMDEKRIRNWLRKEDRTLIAVKKRGVAIDPATVLRRFRGRKGENGEKTVLFLFRGERGIEAVLTEPAVTKK